MKCKCGAELKEKRETILGEPTRVTYCNKCGLEMINLKEVARIQRKLLPEIHETRKVIRSGNSAAITVPTKLANVFRVGSEVNLEFDPKLMELKIKAAK